METKETSKRRITKERHDQVTRKGVCPNCGDFVIVTVARFTGDPLDSRRKFNGSYLCCGGESAHKCWHMTKNPDAKLLYECFGDEPSPRVQQER